MFDRISSSRQRQKTREVFVVVVVAAVDRIEKKMKAGEERAR